MNKSFSNLVEKCENILQNLKNVETDDKEILEKIRIYNSVIFFIKKHKKHPLFKFEVCYQTYRSKFSKTYFEGSSFYCGDSFIDSYNNKPLTASDYIQSMFIYNPV